MSVTSDRTKVVRQGDYYYVYMVIVLKMGRFFLWFVLKRNFKEERIVGGKNSREVLGLTQI